MLLQSVSWIATYQTQLENVNKGLSIFGISHKMSLKCHIWLELVIKCHIHHPFHHFPVIFFQSPKTHGPNSSAWSERSRARWSLCALSCSRSRWVDSNSWVCCQLLGDLELWNSRKFTQVPLKLWFIRDLSWLNTMQHNLTIGEWLTGNDLWEDWI